MAATTVLKTAILGTPQAPIRNPYHNYCPKRVCFPILTRKQTCPTSHCLSIKFSSAQFCPKVLKRHHFGVGSVCFASSGESVETQQVEDEVLDSQPQVHLKYTHEFYFMFMYVCFYV